jgi:hypothetical protein
MIPVFKRAKTWYALDYAATVIDLFISHNSLLTFEGGKEGSLRRLSRFLLWMQFIIAAVQQTKQSSKPKLAA